MTRNNSSPLPILRSFSSSPALNNNYNLIAQSFPGNIPRKCLNFPLGNRRRRLSNWSPKSKTRWSPDTSTWEVANIVPEQRAAWEDDDWWFGTFRSSLRHLPFLSSSDGRGGGGGTATTIHSNFEEGNTSNTELCRTRIFIEKLAAAEERSSTNRAGGAAGTWM